MDGIIKWILENKNWIFSGVGVTILGSIIAITTFFFRRRSAGHGSTKSPIQEPTYNQILQIDQRTKKLVDAARRQQKEEFFSGFDFSFITKKLRNIPLRTYFFFFLFLLIISLIILIIVRLSS